MLNVKLQCQDHKVKNFGTKEGSFCHKKGTYEIPIPHHSKVLRKFKVLGRVKEW